MEEQRDELIRVLIKCVIHDMLEAAEQQLLDDWIAALPDNRTVYEEVTNPRLLEKELDALAGHDSGLLWKQIRKKIRNKR